MMRILLTVLAAMILTTSSAVLTSAQEGNITLYSINKHSDQGLRSCLKIQTMNTAASRGCDIRYGALYVGDDLDWFESSAAQGNRSVIRDLGPLTWYDKFAVPVVEPMPKLAPGEQRTITIDASGADGLPGKSGAPAKNADGTAAAPKIPVQLSTPTVAPRTGGKIDRLFVKAVAGHMYVIRVVDEVSDFYALFRVESLERGDNCTISWRVVAGPDVMTNRVQD